MVLDLGRVFSLEVQCPDVAEVWEFRGAQGMEKSVCQTNYRCMGRFRTKFKLNISLQLLTLQLMLHIETRLVCSLWNPWEEIMLEVGL